ncbi:MAG: sulfite exporter TauE/SafE family protein [Aquificae bacterium]|nr:sulfite exporter TauE/SafE family protein [Aquificota bacterium]
MHPDLGTEVLVSLVTFLFSIVGGITGIGIATIIIPLLLFLGVPLPFAKASALWINVWIMLPSLLKRLKLVRWSLALPLVASAAAFSPLGAKVSFLIPERLQLFMLGTLVIASALLILFLKPKARFAGKVKNPWPLGLAVGAVAGFLGGMLGIGGGIVANPALMLLGVDPLVVTTVSGVMVLLSSLFGWCVYALEGYFSPTAAVPFAAAAVAGSLIGNRLAVRFSRETTRKVVAYFAVFVGLLTYLKALG